MRLLHGTGCKLNLAGQIQAFAALPAHLSFCPDLCNHIIREVRPYLFISIVASHVDRPETAVSRGIPEKGSFVARSEEHAPPGQLLHVPAIRGAVAVSPQAEELLNAGNVRQAERIQFGHFHQPDTRQQFRGILALKGADAVIEPAVRHLIQQRGLAQTLRPAQDEHIVELGSRLIAPGHSRREHFAGDSGGIRAILCAQIIHQQRIQPGHSIPFQRIKILLNLVECVGSGVDVKRGINGGASRDLVELFQRPVHTIRIRIAPHPPLAVSVPRQSCQHLAAPGKAVQGKAALESDVILQNDEYVVDGRLDHTRILAGQFREPRLIRCLQLGIRGLCGA